MDFKLRNRRLELGLTLEQVGEIVGVGKSTVRKWEQGIIDNMGADKIALYAKALKTSPLWILGIDKAEVKVVTSSNSPKQIKLDSFQRAFYEQTEELSDDDKEMLLNIAKHLKAKNNKREINIARADELMAKRIRQARIDAKLTQVELAAKAGVSHSSIQKYEGGRVSDIKRSTIATLARVLNCSPLWLMGYDNEVAVAEANE